jgi:hypothetical protein
MRSHQINKNIILKQSSHLLVFLVDAPENPRNSVIEHQKYKGFLGEDPQTQLFSSQITYSVLGVMNRR